MLSRNKRGFTVVEVLVFATILLLLTGCIAMVVEGGMRFWRLGTAYQDAQSQTLLGMRHMVEDLGESTPVGRSPASPMVDSEHVIVLSPEPLPPATGWTYDGEGLQYHQWLCYYRDPSKNELVRALLPLAGGPVTSDDAPPTPPLRDFQPPRRGSSRVIARGVTELRISDGAAAQQMSLRLTSAMATNSEKSTVVSNRSVVTLPNP